MAYFISPGSVPSSLTATSTLPMNIPISGSPHRLLPRIYWAINTPSALLFLAPVVRAGSNSYWRFGYTFLYQLLVGSISVLAAISGLILLYRLLNKSFSPAMSLLSILSIAGATNLLFTAPSIRSIATQFPFCSSRFSFVSLFQKYFIIFDRLRSGLLRSRPHPRCHPRPSCPTDLSKI